MKILRINDRYFVVSTEREIHDVSLKVLNEQRLYGTMEPRLLDFVTQVCEDMDGDTAWALVQRNEDVEVILPEVL